MSRAYFTENQKLIDSPWPKWTMDECMEMQEILLEKGYYVECGVMRIGCDKKFHDSWRVERHDLPRLVEQLFRRRFTVEVQAEGSGKASINFVYDYHAQEVISAVKKFWKNNNEGDGLL